MRCYRPLCNEGWIPFIPVAVWTQSFLKLIDRSYAADMPCLTVMALVWRSPVSVLLSWPQKRMQKPIIHQYKEKKQRQSKYAYDYR